MNTSTHHAASKQWDPVGRDSGRDGRVCHNMTPPFLESWINMLMTCGLANEVQISCILREIPRLLPRIDFSWSDSNALPFFQHGSVSKPIVPL